MGTVTNPNIVATLGGLMITTLLTGLLQRCEAPAVQSTEKAVDPTGFARFQSDYLITWGVILLADWLQGTHFHTLYESHGLSNEQTGQLFLTGFLSSALFGTYVGVLVDSIGRRRGCALYCILEIAVNVLEHSTDYTVLFTGRILGGISTSLLGCSFESWMVTRHKASGYPDALLQQTFSRASFINGMLAVVAGIIAHLLDVSFDLGPIGPFRAAIFLTAVALVRVVSWEENFGEPSAPARSTNSKKHGADSAGGGAVIPALLRAGSLVRADARLWMLGIVQACFEGGMFAWVSIWVPALMSLQRFPTGLVFSCFMLCISCGANLYSYVQRSLGAVGSTSLFLLLAMCSMMLPLIFPVRCKTEQNQTRVHRPCILAEVAFPLRPPNKPTAGFRSSDGGLLCFRGDRGCAHPGPWHHARDHKPGIDTVDDDDRLPAATQCRCRHRYELRQPLRMDGSLHSQRLRVRCCPTPSYSRQSTGYAARDGGEGGREGAKNTIIRKGTVKGCSATAAAIN